MGLQTDLGFRLSGPNAVQRGLQSVGASRPGAWLFQRTLFHLDKPLYRWSDGRLTIPGLLIGLPVLLLTTTGAKSGLPRTMPVAPIPYEDDLAVLGTNFGQATAPGWVHNLRANPRASVTWRDHSVEVTASPVPADRMDDVWQQAATIYRGFPHYRVRTDGIREVHGFVLHSG